MNSDQHWEKWGKTEPYYGVLSSDSYRKGNLNQLTYKDFFQSGLEHLDFILKLIADKFGKPLNYNNALDFGCGVGRISLPLAKLYKKVFAVDISPSMLKELMSNSEKNNIKNIEPILSDENFGSLNVSFDFIHSHIVFQHINPNRGMKIVSGLLDKLNDGGIGVMHFTYFRNASFLRKFCCKLQSKSILVAWIANILKGRNPNMPHMEMNDYNLNKLFSMIQSKQIDDCYIRFTNDYGHFGLILFIKK